MLITFIKSFFPWILFFIFAGNIQHQLDTAIVIAVIAAVIVEFKTLKKGFIWTWGTLLFFICLLITIVFLKINWITDYLWLISNGILAIIAWLSFFIHQPFTLQFAKEQVAQEKWQHPIFLKINYILTAVWGLIFLLNMILHLLLIHYPATSGWFYKIIFYIPCIFGMGFTVWFPKYYRIKHR